MDVQPIGPVLVVGPGAELHEAVHLVGVYAIEIGDVEHVQELFAVSCLSRHCGVRHPEKIRRKKSRTPRVRLSHINFLYALKRPCFNGLASRIKLSAGA